MSVINYPLYFIIIVVSLFVSLVIGNSLYDAHAGSAKKELKDLGMKRNGQQRKEQKNLKN
jgi:hypothetical protein